MQEIIMDIRRAQSSDFDKVVSFYKYAIENMQEMGTYARWVYGQHPTDAMILKYIEQEAMYLLAKRECKNADEALLHKVFSLLQNSAPKQVESIAFTLRILSACPSRQHCIPLGAKHQR